MMGAIPSNVVTEVQPAIVSRLAGAKVFAAVGSTVSARPALILRGKFVDYDPGGSVVRAVYGTNPTLTAQMELVDAQTRQVIGVAMVTGTVKSVIRAGPGELGDGMSKAVRGLVLAAPQPQAAQGGMSGGYDARHSAG